MKRCICIILFLLGFSLLSYQSVELNNLINDCFRLVRGDTTKGNTLELKGRARLYAVEDHTQIEYWLIDDILPLIVESDWKSGRFKRGSHPFLGVGASEFFSRLARAGALGSIEKIRAVAIALTFQEFHQELLDEALEGIFTGINQFFDYYYGPGFRYDVAQEVENYRDIMREHITTGAIIPEDFPGDVHGPYLAVRINNYYASGLKNSQSISALFKISVNDLIKAIAPNPARWKEIPFGQRILKLAEFEQLIQELKDIGIISQDIDYQDYYPIYLRNYFAFSDARQVETGKILPLLQDLFTGNIAESTEMLYPGYTDYLLPQEALPGELNYVRGMKERGTQELRVFLIHGPEDLRAFAAAEIIRRINMKRMDPRGEGIPLLEVFASLNYAWDRLPEPISDDRRQIRVTQSMVLLGLEELAKEVAEVLDLERPASIATYATIYNPVTRRTTTTKKPVVNISGQFVKITFIDRIVEGGDGYNVYFGVDIYGNTVRFIDEYSPSDIRESGDYRILNSSNWDGYIWPEELFGPGAFTSEYGGP